MLYAIIEKLYRPSGNTFTYRKNANFPINFSFPPSLVFHVFGDNVDELTLFQRQFVVIDCVVRKQNDALFFHCKRNWSKLQNTEQNWFFTFYCQKLRLTFAGPFYLAYLLLWHNQLCSFLINLWTKTDFTKQKVCMIRETKFLPNLFIGKHSILTQPKKYFRVHQASHNISK